MFEIVAFFRTFAQPCRDQTVSISRSLDERLSLGARMGLAMHLLVCRGCRRFRAQLLRLRSAAQRLGTEAQNAEAMPGAVRARLAAALRDESSHR